MFKFINVKSSVIVCNPRVIELEERTTSGLAYTPSQMNALRLQGVPISLQSMDSQFFDGSDNPSYDIPIEQRKGIDPADIWNAELESRRLVNDIKKRRR